MEEILIDIDATGHDVKVEGKDIQGADCKALTKAIEAKLGVVASTVLKPEYHRPKVLRRKVGV